MLYVKGYRRNINFAKGLLSKVKSQCSENSNPHSLQKEVTAAENGKQD